MIPIRTVPPLGPVVPLADLREHLRVSGEDHDKIIEDLERQAVAHLDGYRGILGRCILQQKWSVAFDAAGVFRLPFPDVTEVSVGTLSHDCLGSLVAIDGPATVEMTVAMPEDALEAVKGAVCIWVQKRFDGLTGPEAQAFDAAFADLISGIRWTRV